MNGAQSPSTRPDTSPPLGRYAFYEVPYRREHGVTKPIETDNKARQCLFRFLHSNPYIYTERSIIIFTCVLLGAQADSPETTWYRIVDAFTAIIFIIEAITKIFCLCRDYFSSGWNILDLCLAILGTLVPHHPNCPRDVVRRTTLVSPTRWQAGSTPSP